MNANRDSITEKQFQAYRRLQDAGFINMLDVANGVMLTGLDLSVYRAIVINYDYLVKKFRK